MDGGFRELDSTHLPEMAELFKAAFGGEPWFDDWSDSAQLTEYIKEVSGGYNALNFGLFDNGRLIAMSAGMIRHWWEGANYNIEEFCVLPEYQGRGTGTRFLELISDEVRRRGVKGIFLQTDSDKPSYRFYLKNGFKDLSEHVSLFRGL